MGSVIGLKDESGNTLLEYDYDGFGKAYVVSNGNKIAIENYTGSDYNNDTLFTSREYDKGTKLYYYRARYYSAEQGRFISRDPLGIADDINLYSYVGNNPLNYTDPSELEKALIGGNRYRTNGEYIKILVNGERQEVDADYYNNLDFWTRGDIIKFVGENNKSLEKAFQTSMNYIMGYYSSVPEGEIVSTQFNYAKNFWKALGEKLNGYEVHHSLPQKYIKMFEDIGINIHDAKYLRGVPTEIHREITNLWRKFDLSEGTNISTQEIINFAKKIELEFGEYFIKIK